MDTVAKKISALEYLEMERNAEEKYEYDNGNLTPMSGASLIHNQIVTNLLGLLWYHFRSIENLNIHANDLRVFSHTTKSYYYPNLVITKGTPQLQDSNFDVLLNPSIIIEVLSNSTSTRDRTTKFEAYRSIPSFKEYILIHQSEAKLEAFYKEKENKWIICEPISGIDKDFSFQNLDIKLSLKDVYNKIKF